MLCQASKRDTGRTSWITRWLEVLVGGYVTVCGTSNAITLGTSTSVDLATVLDATAKSLGTITKVGSCAANLYQRDQMGSRHSPYRSYGQPQDPSTAS